MSAHDGELRVRREMFGHLLHNARGSVNTIGFATDNSMFLLEKQQLEAPDIAELRENLEIIQARAKELIDGLTKLQRAYTLDDYPITPTNLPALLLSVKSAIEEAHGLRVTLNLDEESPKIHGNAEVLRLVFLELAENAKAAGARELNISSVTVTPANEKLEVRVTDDGRGMAGDKLQRACEEFFTTRHPARWGLGLSFCQKAVEHLADGKLLIASEPGKGTAITLRISMVTP